MSLDPSLYEHDVEATLAPTGRMKRLETRDLAVIFEAKYPQRAADHEGPSGGGGPEVIFDPKRWVLQGWDPTFVVLERVRAYLEWAWRGGVHDGPNRDADIAMELIAMEMGQLNAEQYQRVIDMFPQIKPEIIVGGQRMVRVGWMDTVPKEIEFPGERWVVEVAKAAAKSFDCNYFMHAPRHSEMRFSFFGLESSACLAAEAFISAVSRGIELGFRIAVQEGNLVPELTNGFGDGMLEKAKESVTKLSKQAKQQDREVRSEEEGDARRQPATLQISRLPNDVDPTMVVDPYPDSDHGLLAYLVPEGVAPGTTGLNRRFKVMLTPLKARFSDDHPYVIWAWSKEPHSITLSSTEAQIGSGRPLWATYEHLKAVRKCARFTADRWLSARKIDLLPPAYEERVKSPDKSMYRYGAELGRKHARLMVDPLTESEEPSSPAVQSPPPPGNRLKRKLEVAFEGEDGPDHGNEDTRRARRS